MKTNHTEGPWRVEFKRLFEECTTEIVSADNSTIAEVFAVKSTVSEIGATNAKLIAAAPELLEALKDIVERYTPCQDGGIQSMKRARAAIAKATN